MGTRKRNWIIFFVIVALAACYFVVQAILNSHAYLDWKAEMTMNEVRAFITEDASQWQSIAEAIMEEALSKDDRTLSRDPYRSEFSDALDTQVNRLIANCPVNFDEVYVGGITQFVYPEGCCVFRHTIEYGKIMHEYGLIVYAWVDLVYAPDCDIQKYPGFAEKSAHIMDDWYVIKFYGY